MFEGRHEDECLTVRVEVPPQSLGQAVWQGRYDVRVGVLGQRVLGPGIVVVLE